MRISNNPHILLLATMPYMYIVMLLIYLFLLETLYLARKSRLLPFLLLCDFIRQFCSVPIHPVVLVLEKSPNRSYF